MDHIKHPDFTPETVGELLREGDGDTSGILSEELLIHLGSMFPLAEQGQTRIAFYRCVPTRCDRGTSLPDYFGGESAQYRTLNAEPKFSAPFRGASYFRSWPYQCKLKLPYWSPEKCRPFFLVSLYMPMQLIDDLDQDRINYYKDRYIMSYGRWCANPSS